MATVNKSPSPVKPKTSSTRTTTSTSAPAPNLKQQIHKKVKSDDGNVRYKCHLCTWEYKTYNSTLRHIAFKHLRFKLTEMYGFGLTCNLCGKGFHDPDCVFEHLVKVHGALKSEIPGNNSTLIKLLAAAIYLTQNIKCFSKYSVAIEHQNIFYCLNCFDSDS